MHDYLYITFNTVDDIFRNVSPLYGAAMVVVKAANFDFNVKVAPRVRD